MLPPPHLISLLLLVLISLQFSAAATSVYDVLRSHGLPIGLLPKGVRDFEMDGDGRFQARLDSPCTATFESDVRYNASVAGTISRGQIAGLSGISAQDLFLWFPVLAIRLDDNASGIIHFDVGVVDKRLPLSLFEDPPNCTPSPLWARTNPTSSSRKLTEMRLKELQSEIIVRFFIYYLKNFCHVIMQSPPEVMVRWIKEISW